ncbi:cobyric acid synthase [Paenibacillus qinlingensis]|uniref:Cobyric acid synthase n=1 Tax=Paenibacillus qinlingensis TaxID=1837343 RepID=A0ABU1P489_9BACL|nr:cobyric acid synthase [Paenibacillus qinlingensis]MDR6554555.1 adenosylcobyric acid synthase [Paenibacillus qinlingensis]
MSESQSAVLMIQGTASDVGKSILTAALCRIFVQDGWLTAPFKSQNMSLNSYITFDGKEIGRAQGVQADACRIVATTDMNPILLKPKQDMVAQVIVHGKPYADLDARTYRESYLPRAEAIVKDALVRLRSGHDIVVLEGAGSPAEVNLKDRDIVNMRLAGWADSPVVLVADIDRGGVFASIVGTLEILTPEERNRVKGFIINKFRGDVSLLKPGLDWLEERTGKPVLGVIPYLQQLGIEDEDSASLDSKRAQTRRSPSRLGKQKDQLDVAVIRLPRLSNFTDFDPLQEEADIHFRYIDSLAEWGEPDVVLIPGSKNTMEDLHYLKESGLAERLISFAQKEEGWIVGICAGYQMLGVTLSDPGKYESEHAELEGLGLLPTQTVFTPDKRTVRIQGVSTIFAEQGSELPIDGYEIHMGRTHYLQDLAAPFQIAETNAIASITTESILHPDGAVTLDGRVWGTYIHGILHNDDFRRSWLNHIRLHKGLAPVSQGLRYKERREAAFDRLAEHVRAHLDMTRIYEMMGVTHFTRQEGF